MPQRHHSRKIALKCELSPHKTFSLTFTTSIPGLLQEIQRRLVRVALQIDDLLHPCVDHHLGAEDAGLVGAVERCPLDADAVHCRLNDGVLLGMHRPAKLVARAALHVLASAADNIAVVEACGRTIVTRGENSLILHEEGIHMIMQTEYPYYVSRKRMWMS